MILNAENVLDFIPSGLLEKGQKAQVGVDLSVKNITKIVGGKLYANGKKEIDKYEQVDFIKEVCDGKTVTTWLLKKGVYSLTFDQSIKLDSKHTAFLIGKSSSNRVGLLIRSGVFDSGFTCDNIGATMYVFEDNKVEIQEGALLGQLIIFENQEAELYNGNYQGNKDLK